MASRFMDWMTTGQPSTRGRPQLTPSCDVVTRVRFELRCCCSRPLRVCVGRPSWWRPGDPSKVVDAPSRSGAAPLKLREITVFLAVCRSSSPVLRRGNANSSAQYSGKPESCRSRSCGWPTWHVVTCSEELIELDGRCSICVVRLTLIALGFTGQGGQMHTVLHFRSAFEGS